jgi:hypothetical protein
MATFPQHLKHARSHPWGVPSRSSSSSSIRGFLGMPQQQQQQQRQVACSSAC